MLGNFLGSFTSRYSDYAGYWMFGMLAGAQLELSIDLIGQTEDTSEPHLLAAATRRARTVFIEQVTKAGLDPARIREASVHLRRAPEPTRDLAAGVIATGHVVTFTARAVSDLGRAYDSTKTVFVAPHDPSSELRSARASR